MSLVNYLNESRQYTYYCHLTLILSPGDRFRLVSWHSRVLQVWRVESNQVVMAARLQSLETSEELSVVTTHLKVIIITIIVIGSDRSSRSALCAQQNECF